MSPYTWEPQTTPLHGPVETSGTVPRLLGRGGGEVCLWVDGREGGGEGGGEVVETRGVNELTNLPRASWIDICWLVGCLTSQQHASESQGWICSDNFTCCHTETEVADPTFYLTQSILTLDRPVPVLTLYRQAGWPLECQTLSHWYDSTRKNPVASGNQAPDLPLSRWAP